MSLINEGINQQQQQNTNYTGDTIDSVKQNTSPCSMYILLLRRKQLGSSFSVICLSVVEGLGMDSYDVGIVFVQILLT